MARIIDKITVERNYRIAINFRVSFDKFYGNELQQLGNQTRFKVGFVLFAAVEKRIVPIVTLSKKINKTGRISVISLGLAVSLCPKWSLSAEIASPYPNPGSPTVFE